ncbi:zinc finger protein 638-like [Morone saxatilis]|uniref:zinc finger protein 638-like n=1 Tax=Morone saxatilis TaxID=34816 RepID=UPI0015E24B79|nr:zinc finger protein 638-like [Morone saxatilis]
MKKQKTQQQRLKRQMRQKLKRQQKKMQKEQASHTGQAMGPAAISVPPASLIPSLSDASWAMQQPGNPRPIVIPPALPQPVPSLIGFNNMTLATSSKQPPAVVSKCLPTPAMMHDYAAAPPKIFPHTCSLCNKECTHMKDWLSHQNTSLHLQNCNLLRKQYPDWDGEIALEPRAAGIDAKPAAPTSAQTSQNRRQKTSHGSHSRSRSSSPRRHRGLEGRRAKSSSRSRSPHSPRYTRRSRSRSPWYNHPTSSHYRSRWRGDKWSSPRKNDGRRSPPRRSDERRSPPRRSDGRRSPPRRSDERRSPPRRRSGERRFLTEGSSLQRKKSSSAERLAKKLLETSAVQSLSRQSDLETVVKTLAPALLAELVKMNTSSSSSSSSKGGKPSSSPAVGNKLSSVVSCLLSSTAKKKLTTKPSKANPSPEKSESGKSSPPTMVRLDGIYSSLSHNDVVAAVEQFGKTKSVVLFRSVSEAIVCFEKEEHANKLKSVKNFQIKGMAVTIVREQDTVSNEQKKPPQKKPATSSVSTPHTTLSKTVTTTRNMTQLKEPLPSGAMKATAGKLANQKIAPKGSVKGTKAKVLVSKAKKVSTKQMAKKVKTGKLPAKGPVKKVAVKRKSSKSTAHAPETKTVASRVQQRAARFPTEAAVEAMLQSGEVETKTMQKDPVTEVMSKRGATSAKDASTASLLDLNQGQDDFSDDSEEIFNMDDFVTVDEIGDDLEDKSPESTETPSSPGHKTQQRKAKSPFKASNTTSSCSTHSVYAACEREMITSAVTDEASIETHLEWLREEAKATEGAVIAAKTVESETKLETSSEMHSPPQGQGFELSQVQSLDIDVKVPNKSKEEGKDDDVDKHTKEEEDENYQILNSLDDRTDEQMDDEEQYGSSKIKQTGSEESYQVLDSVDNEDQDCQEVNSEMKMDGSFQVLESVTEDQAATSQVDSLLVQDAVPVVDKSHDAIKDQEINNKDLFQVLDTGRKQASMGNGDGKTKEEEEDKGKVLTVESCKAFKDVENPDGQIPNEDQPLQDGDDDCTEQETFEILDSIDDQTATEDKLETPNDQLSKEELRSIEEEEGSYQVTDSLEDQPVTTESEKDNMERRIEKREATARKDDGPSKRSGPKTTTARGQKEDKITDTYEILDAVEDETADDEPTVTRLSTRGKRERTGNKDSSNEKTKKEETPTRRRHTPARESQELNKKPTPKKEEKAPRKESSPTKKSDVVTEVSEEDATYEILDSMEDDVKDDRPATGLKGRRGRPKKEVNTTKKDASRSQINTATPEEENKLNSPEKHYKTSPLVNLVNGRARDTKGTLETRPLHQEDESEDSLNPETLVTLDEAGDDDEEEQPHEEEAEKTSRSAKRKHDDDTEESVNFVIVDEVKEEEENESVTTRTRGRAEKRTRTRTRQTPVDPPTTLPVCGDSNY